MSASKLPVGWTAARVGEICEADNGRAFKSSEWEDTGTPIIRIGNLKNPDAGFNYFQGEIGPKHRVTDGDLLFAWSGTPGTSFGAHVWRGPDAALNQHIFNLRFPRHLLATSYFRYALDENVRSYVQQAQGGVGLAHITKRKFMASDIPLAPFPEQSRIVEALDSYLSRLDAAQAALERVQANLERYRASVLQAAVEGRLVPTEAELARQEGRDYEPASVLLERILIERRERWEEAELAKMRAKGKEPKTDKWKAKYKEPAAPETSELPALPEGWCWASLDQVSWASGYGTSVRCDPAAQGIPVLRIPNVADARIDLADLKYATKDIGKDPFELLHQGDFLIIRTNGSRSLIGRAAYVVETPEPLLFFASYLIRFRLLGGPPVGRWLSHYWLAPTTRAQLESLAATSAGQYNLSMTSLAPVLCAIPPLAEQERLNTTVDAATSITETQAKEVAASVARISVLRQSILQWAFNGKLVEQDPDDEPASILLDRIRAEREAVAPKKTRRKKKATA